MIDFESRLSKAEIEIASLKEKIAFFNVIYEKLDTTLEKVQKAMEDRRTDTNQDLKDVYTKIDDTENKLVLEMYKLRDDMIKLYEKNNSRIEELNRWRWVLMGGSVVIGFILSKVGSGILEHLSGK